LVQALFLCFFFAKVLGFIAMCRQNKAAVASGDEVFEASDSEASVGEESDCESVDSDVATAASPVRLERRLPEKSAPETAKVPPLPPSLDHRAVSLAAATASECCGAAASRAPVQSKGPEGGLMGLVAHLRTDNGRLREALVQAQRDMEALAAKQGKEGKEDVQSIDFGHLLSLVKDFGDDLGFYADEGFQAQQGTGAVEVFAMDAESDDETEPVAARDEVSQLRAELEHSREEVELLRKEMAAKDEELIKLRSCLAAK